MVGICCQNYQTYYFFYSQESKFSAVKELFHNQGSFSQSRNFCYGTVVNILHGQGDFLRKNLTWSRKFSTKNEFFYCQGNFLLEKNLLDQKCFLQTGNFFTKFFSLIMKVFYKQRFLHSQKNFLQTRIKKVL